MPLFEHDVFLSYAAADNHPWLPDRPGWVEEFEGALRVRLHQVLGREINVWFDEIFRYE